MVMRTSIFIDALSLNDYQPRLKSDPTTHEMEVISDRTSNWYSNRSLGLDIVNNLYAV